MFSSPMPSPGRRYRAGWSKSGGWNRLGPPSSPPESSSVSGFGEMGMDPNRDRISPAPSRASAQLSLRGTLGARPPTSALHGERADGELGADDPRPQAMDVIVRLGWPAGAGPRSPSRDPALSEPARARRARVDAKPRCLVSRPEDLDRITAHGYRRWDMWQDAAIPPEP
jgi:hypothetical protein